MIMLRAGLRSGPSIFGLPKRRVSEASSSWQSLDAIRGFAGADLEEAVVSNEIVSLFSQFDQRVRHYELIMKDEA